MIHTMYETSFHRSWWGWNKYTPWGRWEGLITDGTNLPTLTDSVTTLWLVPLSLSPTMCHLSNLLTEDGSGLVRVLRRLKINLIRPFLSFDMKILTLSLFLHAHFQGRLLVHNLSIQMENLTVAFQSKITRGSIAYFQCQGGNIEGADWIFPLMCSWMSKSFKMFSWQLSTMFPCFDIPPTFCENKIFLHSSLFQLLNLPNAMMLEHLYFEFVPSMLQLWRMHCH